MGIHSGFCLAGQWPWALSGGPMALGSVWRANGSCGSPYLCVVVTTVVVIVIALHRDNWEKAEKIWMTVESSLLNGSWWSMMILTDNMIVGMFVAAGDNGLGSERHFWKGKRCARCGAWKPRGKCVDLCLGVRKTRSKDV
ncbi:uncharacterized protein HKW66_Vig0027130 [Vigna angularis]|uniref:Uncharacterized protein n=1 Tax=Phaseolus angularis TaxID=3914 RepID=A0A8T0L8N2_PHAAN|nr:uncharacterized protein HKW66_Vig0027130 [Vigna angularis]